MQTSDRFRMFRSLGLATAALLLVGGAVFGSQAIIGDNAKDDSNQPASASADEHGNVENGDGSQDEDASESPEASPEESEDASPDADVKEDVNDDDASESDDESESESESPEASESPDDDDGNSGHGGSDDS